MEGLIWAGALVSLAGLSAILWCIVAAMKARRAGMEDAALRERLQRIVVINLAAFFASALGLMLVVVGIILK